MSLVQSVLYSTIFFLFREMVLLQLHAHLNAVFVHFVEFHFRFHTLDDKELEVLPCLMLGT